MVCKYFGTWMEVSNHFENIFIKKWILRFFFMILSMLNIVKVLCA